MMIRGTTVTLIEEVWDGHTVDDFNRPIRTENSVDIDNVLIAPLSDTEVLETLNLTGRKAVYQLAIPKGDAHRWIGNKVIFFGRTWSVIGEPTEGMEELIPLEWNRKVKVERING